MTRVVLVPGVLALLPEYVGFVDPVADLRAACLDAVAWLGPSPRVVASEQGGRVAASLEAEVSRLASLAPQPPQGLASLAPQPPTGDGVLIVANGSATRSEKAPGHLDERAIAFDDDLRDALTRDPSRLAAIDQALAVELWADTESLGWLGKELDLGPATIDYDDDPYGVQLWVARFEGDWR